MRRAVHPRDRAGRGLDTYLFKNRVESLAPPQSRHVPHGENGSGKATLVEAIASPCGSTSRVRVRLPFHDPALDAAPDSLLRDNGGARRPRADFFLRTESVSKSPVRSVALPRRSTRPSAVVPGKFTARADLRGGAARSSCPRLPRTPWWSVSTVGIKPPESQRVEPAAVSLPDHHEAGYDLKQADCSDVSFAVKGRRPCPFAHGHE